MKGMKAFKVLLTCAICTLVSSTASAQEKNKCLLRVSQTFHGWVDCHSHTPTWKETTLKVGEKEGRINPDKKSTDITLNAFIKDDSLFWCTDSSNVLLCLHLSVGRIEHNHDWKDTIKVKINKNSYPHSDDEVCGGWGDSEGYDATIYIITDDYIDVTTASVNDNIIGKDEVKLKFSKFYENGGKRVLQYRCENASDKSWFDVKNNPIITSGGEVSLSYEDIVGKYSDNNERYFDCIGKEIYFRVVKTLLDGKTQTCGNIGNCKFYLPCPEVEVPNINRPWCEDSLQIRARFDKTILSKLPPDSKKYRWILNDSYEYVTDTIVEGYDILRFKKVKDRDLKEWQPSDEQQQCALKLLLNEHYFEGSTPTEFTIYAKKDSIEVAQVEKPEEQTYHIYNTSDPYVTLSIKDNDTSPLGRMPYQILNRDKSEVLATINEVISPLTQEEQDSLYEEFCKTKITSEQ